MADNTGAPWLLPYPEDTDLVRDGASDIEALAVAVASGLTAANKGIGTNVVQTVRTDTLTIAADVETTIVSVTITPSTATSKVLLIAKVNVGSGTGTARFRFTGGNSTTFVGQTAGSRVGTTEQVSGPTASGSIETITSVFVDSPATTSAVTYNFQGVASGTSIFINRSTADVDNTFHFRTACSFVAIEVAA